MKFILYLFSFGICFISSHARQTPASRIIGGTDAVEGAVPYQVSLRTPSNFHFCGGSVIAKRWVLTAAHCTRGYQPSGIQVIVGTNNLTSGGAAYSVDKIFIHEDFDLTLITNDISLLVLSQDIVFGNSVQPIDLPTKDTEGGSNVMLTGWGSITYAVEQPKWLQTINLTALSVAECKERMRYVYPPTLDSQICTFSRAGQGACYGDSGSPVVEGASVVGISSWVLPCAQGYPDVHTRVYSFLGWIQSRISENES